MQLQTAFPNWTRSRLERTAVAHANELAMDRGRDFDPSGVPVDRLVVNMLRHEHTDYDAHQTAAAHRAACDAIARTYSWLITECRWQADAREEQERMRRDMIAVMERDRAAAADRQRERVAASSRLIGRFAPGHTVVATVRGHRRVAEVVKVGRTRVTIRFTIKSGAERTAVLHACDLTPA